MLRRITARLAATTRVSRRSREDPFEAPPIDLFEDMSIGSLVPRATHSDWEQEEKKFDSVQKVSSGSYERFLPESVREWTRIKDREAGDDDCVSFRGEKDQVVMDTKLIKGMGGPNEWAAVKTAGIDKIIAIIKNSSTENRPALWESVVSRIEYLACTLSVKNIRLVLEALASRFPEEPIPVSSEAVRLMTRALGQELLCRFHSMTLLSCSRIAKSIAVLSSADKGTLNMIALCFKQNLDKTPWQVSDTEVAAMTIEMINAYSKLGHVVPILIDSATAVATQVEMTLDKKIQVLHFVVSHDQSDQAQTRIQSLLVGEETSGMGSLSAASIVLLAKTAPLVNDEKLTAGVRRLIAYRVVVSDKVSIKGGKMAQGDTIIERALSFGEMEALRNCLEDQSPLRQQLDRFLAYVFMLEHSTI